MKISIIVPIYQVEAYLKECVNSLLNQDFSDYEVLLIDDGSPDQCGAICDEYARQDARIRVFHRENKGASAARNLGMEVATGEWLMFVDPDDWLEGGALRAMYSKAVETQCDIVCATFYWEYLDRQVLARPEEVEDRLYFVKEHQEFLFECATCRTDPGKEIWLRGPCWKVYRAAHLRAHQIFFPVDLKISEDMIFNLYVIYYAKKIFWMKLPVYHYRKRKSSASHTTIFRPESYAALHAFMKEHQLTKEIEPHYYRLVVNELINYANVLSDNAYNFSAYHAAVQELTKISNCPDYRKAIKNIDLSSLPIKRKIAWFLLRWEMYRVFVAARMVLHMVSFNKVNESEVYWP